MKLHAYALVAAAACSWGTWRTILLATERLAPGLDARVESAVVMVVITLFGFALLPFAKSASVEVRGPRTTRDWIGVAWLGIADAMNIVLLFAAYGKTSVAIAVTTHYLAPLFVALAAPLVLGEHSPGARTLAFGGAFGLVLLLRPWSSELTASDVIGAAAGAGSAVFYASNVLVNKRLVAKFTAVELMAYHGVFATPLLVVLVPMHGYAALTLPAVAVLVIGGIGPGALGGILFIRALRHVRASHASTITLLEPVVAMSIAALFYAEKLRPMSWVGAAIVLGCTASVAHFGKRA